MNCIPCLKSCPSNFHRLISDFGAKRIPSPWFINGIKKVPKRPGKKPSPTMSACCKPRRGATTPRTRAAFCPASSSVSIPAGAVTTAFSRTNSCSLDNKPYEIERPFADRLVPLVLYRSAFSKGRLFLDLFGDPYKFPGSFCQRLSFSLQEVGR